MTAMIRSASLSGLAELAASLGVDPFRALADVGLTAACLQDDDMRISVRAVGRMLENVARAANCDDFGLRLAEKRNLSNLGPVGLIVREQATIREAIGALMRYLPVHNETLLLGLREDEEEEQAVLSVSFVGAAGTPSRHSVELSVGVLYRILKALLGPAWQARSIQFMHAPPRRIDTHLRVFGRISRFKSHYSGIAIRLKDLDRPIPSADPAMERYIQKYLDTLSRSRSANFVLEVKELIRVMLPAGHCSNDRAARHLGVDRRTLHRRLTALGHTFTSLVSEVRDEFVFQFLAGPDRSLTEIAEYAGFSSISAFSRWFRSQHGCSAREWRRKKLAVADA